MSAASGEKLGIATATCYVIGSVVGSGIFVSPIGVLQSSGSVGLSLIIWAVCGVLSLLGALCYIELGSSIPVSGCDFAYLCHYGWDPLAFAFLFTNFFIYEPCALAILGKTFGAYIVQALTPVLDISFYRQSVVENLLGVLCVMLFMWINFFKLAKYAAKIQIIVTVFQALALGVIIVSGLVYIGEGHLSNFDNPMDGSQYSANLVLAFYTCLWSYDGWETLNFGIEELNNSKRTLFVSTFLGITSVTLVYLLTNIAYFAVIDKSDLLNSTAVAETFSQDILGGFSYAVPVIVGVVIVGNMNTLYFVCSRYFYSASRQGHLPGFMKLLNINHHTPQSSLVTYAIFGVIFMNVPSIETLIDCATFVVFLQKVFTISGLLWMRYTKKPVSPNAIKIPIVIHVIFLCCCFFLVVVETYTSWKLTLIGYGVAFIGLCIYFLLVRPKYSPDWLHSFDAHLMKLCQIIFYSVPGKVEYDEDASDISSSVDPKKDLKVNMIVQKF